MLVGAILVVGPNISTSGRDSGLSDSHENLGGDPIASIEVLGQSLLQRSVSRLHENGIREIAVVADRNLVNLIKAQLPRSPDLVFVNRPADLWSAAQRRFKEFIHNGVEAVVVMRLGAYVEFDLEQLLQFHREQGQPVTPLVDRNGSLDHWVLNAFPDRSASEDECTKGGIDEEAGRPFQTLGYVNRLANARDLRQLVVDSFLGRCQIKPNGIHQKPGIWVDEGAQVHRRARIVAPAYIGRNVKVLSDALITRCSSLERGCEVGYGTVVEDASILRDTCLGTGLDVTHAVVWGRNLINLRHDVELEINDSKLLSGPAKVHRRPLHTVDPTGPAAVGVPRIEVPGIEVSGIEVSGHDVPVVDVSGVDLKVQADRLRGAAKDAKPAFVPPRRNAWAG